MLTLPSGGTDRSTTPLLRDSEPLDDAIQQPRGPHCVRRPPPPLPSRPRPGRPGGDRVRGGEQLRHHRGSRGAASADACRGAERGRPRRRVGRPATRPEVGVRPARGLGGPAGPSDGRARVPGRGPRRHGVHVLGSSRHRRRPSCQRESLGEADGARAVQRGGREGTSPPALARHPRRAAGPRGRLRRHARRDEAGEGPDAGADARHSRCGRLPQDDRALGGRGGRARPLPRPLRVHPPGPGASAAYRSRHGGDARRTPADRGDAGRRSRPVARASGRGALDARVDGAGGLGRRPPKADA